MNQVSFIFQGESFLLGLICHCKLTEYEPKSKEFKRKPLCAPVVQLLNILLSSIQVRCSQHFDTSVELILIAPWNWKVLKCHLLLLLILKCINSQRYNKLSICNNLFHLIYSTHIVANGKYNTRLTEIYAVSLNKSMAQPKEVPTYPNSRPLPFQYSIQTIECQSWEVTQKHLIKSSFTTEENRFWYGKYSVIILSTT